MEDQEDNRLRSAAIQNSTAILIARQRGEQELIRANEALRLKTAELAHSLSMMRATLEATADGILVTDDAGKVTGFNENYVKMWRIPPDIMASGDHRQILETICKQFEGPGEFMKRTEAICASSPQDSFDVLELADGRVFEQCTRVQCVDERSVGRVWSVREITERKRAERDHAYLAAIIASSTDGIVSKTLDGMITSWNAGAERIFGYTAAEAIGKPIAIIVPPDHLEEEQKILDRLRRGEAIEPFETVRVRKDGKNINVSLTISPVKAGSGEIIGASKIARDITEARQLLARELAARTRAEEASRLKDEFLATVSHELRTPLNAILGWAQMLQSGKLDEGRSRHAVEVVERNAIAQAQMIEDLLDVSRIITGKLRLNVQAGMPAAAVESALDAIRPTAAAKGVRLESVIDSHAGPILGDSARLQQIVWNLVSNAIKFTPKGGWVQVRLALVNSHVEITVSDSGQGIGPEFLPYVFDRFRQADASTTRTTGGLGLGLAIVRHLVELHGGAVTADSPGDRQGAIFTVRLPLLVGHPRRDEGGVHPEIEGRSGPLPILHGPHLAGVRVLVVEDEPDTRSILKDVLESCGAEVRDAGTARQGLEEVQKWRPTVIVSDIGMVGEDGYALIRNVREWEKEVGTWTPAVALTAYARSEDRMQALSAGYQIHVAKPVQPMELARVVASLIRPVSPYAYGPETRASELPPRRPP